MNLPARRRNWRWRCTEDMLSRSSSGFRFLTQTRTGGCSRPAEGNMMETHQDLPAPLGKENEAKSFATFRRLHDGATQLLSNQARVSGSTTSPAIC